MNQTKRVRLAVILLFVIMGIVLGVDFIQRQSAAARAPAEIPPGSVPIYVNGQLITGFVPADLEQLKTVSFVDAEEGKTQDGWLLRDVLLLYLGEDNLHSGMQIIVSSSSREKEKTLTWAEVEDGSNMVMFDLSGRGTLKLVST
ncbi:MAG: hypothetical protein AB1649_13930, partial [Chloroflexota bacterium]